jgi:large subunit ribosomal protein L29
MDIQEVRSLSTGELASRLDDFYQELFNLRFQRATGQLSNTARKREVKRSIARIKTVLRERQLAVE